MGWNPTIYLIKRLNSGTYKSFRASMPDSIRRTDNPSRLEFVEQNTETDSIGCFKFPFHYFRANVEETGSEAVQIDSYEVPEGAMLVLNAASSPRFYYPQDEITERETTEKTEGLKACAEAVVRAACVDVALSFVSYIKGGENIRDTITMLPVSNFSLVREGLEPKLDGNLATLTQDGNGQIEAVTQNGYHRFCVGRFPFGTNESTSTSKEAGLSQIFARNMAAALGLLRVHS